MRTAIGLSLAMISLASSATAQAINADSRFNDAQQKFIGTVPDVSGLSGLDPMALHGEGQISAAVSTSDVGKVYDMGARIGAKRAAVTLPADALNAAAAVVNDPVGYLGYDPTAGTGDAACEPGEMIIPGEDEVQTRYCANRPEETFVLTETLEVNQDSGPGYCFVNAAWFQHKVSDTDDGIVYGQHTGPVHVECDWDENSPSYYPSGSVVQYGLSYWNAAHSWIVGQGCSQLTTLHWTQSALAAGLTYVTGPWYIDPTPGGAWLDPDELSAAIALIQSTPYLGPAALHHVTPFYSCDDANSEVAEEWIKDAAWDQVEDHCVISPAICVDGPRQGETQSREMVYRDCWVRESRATCRGGTGLGTNSCQSLFDEPSCTETGGECITYSLDGTKCLEEELSFECTSAGADEAIPMQCHAVEICINGLCETHEDDPGDGGFMEAMSSLAMVDSAAGDASDVSSFDGVRIFGGRDRNCRVQPFGALNCCKDNGWNEGLFTQCSTDELTLAASLDANTAVHTRTRCSIKFLFGCVEKKRHYCTYPSLMAKIVQQQGRSQLGQGIPHNCGGFTQEEFAQLDLDAIDLSPVFGEVMNASSVFDQQDMLGPLNLRLTGVSDAR